MPGQPSLARRRAPIPPGLPTHHHRIEPVMSSFFKLLNSVFFGAPPQRDADEAYLAASVDIYDLERRMREIDQRGRSSACSVAPWLYIR